MLYTGIGSRKTPRDMLLVMRVFARTVAAKGWTLRSGGAEGADTAFEQGAGPRGIIYLPGSNFSPSTSGAKRIVNVGDARFAAEALVKTVHPAWSRLTPPVRALHARNAFQVLGLDLKTPSDFVICWTPCGAQSEDECTRATGGTATAIRIASRFKVPVFNLQRPGAMADLSFWFNLP